MRESVGGGMLYVMPSCFLLWLFRLPFGVLPSFWSPSHSCPLFRLSFLNLYFKRLSLCTCVSVCLLLFWSYLSYVCVCFTVLFFPVLCARCLPLFVPIPLSHLDTSVSCSLGVLLSLSLLVFLSLWSAHSCISILCLAVRFAAHRFVLFRS